jgi:cell division protein FtsI/penicillin-binding protein 2
MVRCRIPGLPRLRLRSTRKLQFVVMVENAGDGSAVAAPITERILEYYFFLREGAQP